MIVILWSGYDEVVLIQIYLEFYEIKSTLLRRLFIWWDNDVCTNIDQTSNRSWSTSSKRTKNYFLSFQVNFSNSSSDIERRVLRFNRSSFKNFIFGLSFEYAEAYN